MSAEREAAFLRPDEAAALAGLSTRAIDRAIEGGGLGAARLCSRLRIPRAAFDDWVERSAVRAVERMAAEPAPPRPGVAGSFCQLLARRGSTPS
jgi:excisionase family DNA binding protein